MVIIIISMEIIIFFMLITLFLARPSAIIQSDVRSGRRSLGSRRHSCATHSQAAHRHRSCHIFLDLHNFTFPTLLSPQPEIAKHKRVRLVIHNPISCSLTYVASQLHPRPQITIYHNLQGLAKILQTRDWCKSRSYLSSWGDAVTRLTLNIFPFLHIFFFF